MKKFFLSLLKALGYFGIYLGTQMAVSMMYSIIVVVPVVVKYSLGNYNLTDVLLSLLPEAWLASYEASSSVAFLGELWVMVIGTVIIAPIVEEIIFRGLAYTRMKKGMPKVVAMLLAAALFGLAHGHPVWMLYTFVFGLALIWVFERTKSLFGSILLHVSYNLCAVLQLLLPADTPDWVGTVMVAAAVLVTAIGMFWFLKIPKAEEPVEELAVAKNQ